MMILFIILWNFLNIWWHFIEHLFQIFYLFLYFPIIQIIHDFININLFYMISNK